MKAAVAAVAVLGGTALAYAQVPAGPEFRVNSYTTGSQVTYGGRRTIAAARTGEFVVVYEQYDRDGSLGGVFARRFDSVGAPIGDDFLVNSFTTDTQRHGVVAMDGRGNFVVVWHSVLQDGSGRGIFAQRYAASGAARGPEFPVNGWTTGDQLRPGVAMDDAGNFVVVWNSDVPASIDGAVVARLFDAAGIARGPDFQVGTYATATPYLNAPSVDMDAVGNFVVAWDSIEPNGGRGILARSLDATGNPRGPEFGVNTYTTGAQRDPSVAVGDAGNFSIVWDSPGAGGSIRSQSFSASGAPLGAELQLFFGSNPAAAADASGNIVVSADGLDVSARRVAADGTPRGPGFLVNTYTPGAQFQSSVASDPAGNFVVMWGSLFQDGNGWGIYAQRYGGVQPTALRVDTTGNGILEPGEMGDVRPTWRNVNGAAQTFGAALGAAAGPGGGVPQIVASVGAYGTVADGASAECATCYTVQIPAPVPRPALHWDGTVVETIVPDALGQQTRWRLHIGSSFSDVAQASPFYRFVETLLHHDVTTGCGAGAYCPAATTTREQMAVFVLVAREGALYVPAACGTTPAFGDVPASSPFCRWIEELARRGVVAGCGGGSYCPTLPVSREQMPVFVLRTLDPALSPPACTTDPYSDVPASDPFCRWILELTARGVVTGCGGGRYCPTDPVTREQMGVFISATFGLTLYGP